MDYRIFTRLNGVHSDIALRIVRRATIGYLPKNIIKQLNSKMISRECSDMNFNLMDKHLLNILIKIPVKWENILVTF